MFLALPGLAVACSGDDSSSMTGGTDSGTSAGDASRAVDEASQEAATAMDGEASADQALDAGANCPSLADAASSADPSVAPATLVETGLYCDITSFAVVPSARQFRPQFQLWSDGAVKTRWIELPPGAKIDTSNPDHWSFPVGTKFWKEFKYQGKRIETRMIARYGPGADDFLFVAYRWDDAETTATLVPSGGVPNAAPIGPGAEGLLHDIPSGDDCRNCHGKLPEHVLGFGAIQLSHSLGGLTITDLVHEDLLTNVPEAGAAGYTVPGDDLDRAALGYLHANCGNCHSDTGSNPTYPKYIVRLLVSNATVESTWLYRTAVNVPHTWAMAPADVGMYRIEGGNSEKSELYYRTGIRVMGQMPPLATKVVDDDGRATLKQWIDRLPPPGGGAADAAEGG
jgi:hypothetical protein